MIVDTAVAIQALKYSGAPKNSLAYKSALRLLENPENGVVTGKSFGTGRYASSKAWSTETMKLLSALGVECERSNVAPRGGLWGERVSLTRTQKHLIQVYEAILAMYKGPRNRWRFEAELAIAVDRILKGLSYTNKRAQWGGKWGNYYRMVALNASGRYVFVCGFNPERFLK